MIPFSFFMKVDKSPYVSVCGIYKYKLVKYRPINYVSERLQNESLGQEWKLGLHL